MIKLREITNKLLHSPRPNRREIDVIIKLTYLQGREDEKKLLNNPKNHRKAKRKIRGFTCSAFDLLHAGHVMMLKECKKYCDTLIVGLHTDPSTDREWKHKPIETIQERKIRLEACKYVDEIIIYETEADLYKLLNKIKPDVRFLGEDHKDKQFTGDNLPIKIIYNTRKHDYSSSNLIERIKNTGI